MQNPMRILIQQTIQNREIGSLSFSLNFLNLNLPPPPPQYPFRKLVRVMYPTRVVNGQEHYSGAQEVNPCPLFHSLPLRYKT
jgi:hypothetical protein